MRTSPLFQGLIFFLATVLAGVGMASESDQKLFINLSSDRMDRAAMAIGFATKARKQKQIPVTLFLNVDGVRLADKRLPEHRHANGSSLKHMLHGLVNAGGRVIICPVCMQNAGGMTKDDLIEGVEVGGPRVTWPALFAEGTTVLSY